jgi:hypothetical protein
MRSLFWKEWREIVKWIALPSFLLLGPMLLFGVPMLLEAKYLAYVSLVAGLSGALLGFFQVFSEARGDKRSLLMHRPLSLSRIYLGKVIAGVGLYLVALLVPTACVVGLAATPGHVAAPFEWRMTLPWLADVLTGLVYYFAGMLIAQREARWYGSRCLPLAAGLFASLLVWNMAEFWQALVAIGLLSGLVAVAAWGSILGGGAYPQQPRLAKIALAVTLFTGLSVLGFAGKVTVGLWIAEPFDYPYDIDRHGHLFLIHETGSRITSITDLQGRVPEGFNGERLDSYAVREIKAVFSNADPQPKSQSYRNPGRYLLEYKNETTPIWEAWWYVPARGRILGYDKGLKHFLGSFGPDGFVPPQEQPRERFQGDVNQKSLGYQALARDPLAFPTGAYTVDFHKGSVRKVFVPPSGENIRWASKRENRNENWAMLFVGTDKAIYFFDQAGRQLLAVPLAYDPGTNEVNIVGRLVNPDRYWVWYSPQWHLPLHTQATSPEAIVVVYDSAGRECEPRQEVPPRPGVARLTPFLYSDMIIQPSFFQTLSGLATSPAEVVALEGTTSYLEAEAPRFPSEISLLLQNLWFTTQAYLPGVRWDSQAHPGLVRGFAALVLLAALVSGLACFLLPRRYAFSRARRLGWTMCGLLFGPTGVVLMISLQEWPAQIACPKCRKLRVVTRETCEHCGAAHAEPAADGTEIIEPSATTSAAVLIGQSMVCH